MKPIYALSAVLDKHPNIISGAVLAWVNVLIALGVLELDGKEVSALNLALAGTLSLFVASKTANVAVLNELAQDPPSVDGVPLAPAVEPANRGRNDSGQVSIGGIVVAILIAVFILWLLGVRI